MKKENVAFERSTTYTYYAGPKGRDGLMVWGPIMGYGRTPDEAIEDYLKQANAR